MARRKKERFIQKAPNYAGFRPVGLQQPSNCEVTLHYEEYESIKLCDYENLKHEEAAEMMKVSRPTFTRIYQSARQKMAKALVEAATICIEGGKVIVEVEWFFCKKCSVSFSAMPGSDTKCPFCKSDKLIKNN